MLASATPVPDGRATTRLHPIERWFELADSMTTFFEVAFLSFNLDGLRTRLGHRVRIDVTSLGLPQTEHLMIVPSGRPGSPFWMTDEYLVAGGYPVATVGRVCDDDATAGHLRCFDGSRWRAATINPTPLSHCTACSSFPTTPQTQGNPRLQVVDELNQLLDGIAAEVDDAGGNLTDLDEITAPTGGLHTETAALQRLRTLRHVLNERGLEKTRIGFPTSQLRTPEAFEHIADEMAPFLLILTAECATRREKLLTATKTSLTPDQMPEVLQAARAAGLDTSFTYTAGLDPLEDMTQLLAQLMPHVTVFPSIHMLQPHTPTTDPLHTPGADDVTYYLQARRAIERITPDRLLPERWRCTQSLWYTQFRGHKLASPNR
jgi:hypothetical protein